MKNVANYPSLYALLAAFITMTVGIITYVTLEPTGVLGATTETFEVTQEIGAEVSFTAAPNNVIMRTTAGASQIGAVSGGTSYGSTSVRVYTNDTAGYTLNMSFASQTAMILNGGTAVISNHASDTTPSYEEPAAASGEAYFAFTASTTDINTLFEYSGTTCNSAGSFSTSTCWYMPNDATNNTLLVDGSGATEVGGDYTDINFIVVVGPNNTGLPNGTYTATATLTAAPKS